MELYGAFLMGILFSASLSEDTGMNLLFTPSNKVSRQYNVYETYIGKHPVSSYWTIWGGRYDNPVVNQIEAYIGGQKLIRVDSLEDCCITEDSIYDEATPGNVYINVHKHTWLYDDKLTDFRKLVSFLSGSKNPDNPSDDIFYNEHWPARLEVPKLNVKLSDVVNGIIRYSTFDFTLYNDDGYFDDLEVKNFFNAPSYIKKTWKENPNADNFITIRYGMVESIKVDDKNMIVSCADIFRTLEEPVSKVIKDVFPDAIENRDKNAPVVYGEVVISLIKIDVNKYIAGENIKSVSAVYDNDGNSISFTFSSTTKIITTSTDNAKSAKATGDTNNKIGQIITNIIADRTTIKYKNSFWDLNETNEYVNTSPKINIAFEGGTVQSAIKNALSSDMVFLIQKNDGKFSLREWGQTYNTFNFKSWEITKFPVKDYSDAQKDYFSSCIIKYKYTFSDKVYNSVLLYDADETTAESTYNKLLRKEFNTFLTNDTDAYKLGVRLSNRFSTLKETIQIGVGHNTGEINLLDTVELELNINGRVFSKNTTWIVKEIDPAQDILTLESV
jgi:hypothetical protein